ncbi:site-2 protease family protein [Alicyclobacillus fructus]|uniref:site-2 protease family protein n=1 Tax=Alicyclobacillus fructus TaxID=2816082 RepID=UPI001A8CA66F
MLSGISCVLAGILHTFLCTFPRTLVGWIVASATVWPQLYVRIMIHELGHYVMRRVFGVPTERVIFGSGKRFLRVGRFEFRPLPLGGYNLPYTYCSDVSVKKKIWVYRAGMLANFLTIWLWIHNPFWVLMNLWAIWTDSRVTVQQETGYVSDGAWIALLRGRFRLPEGFDPCKTPPQV